MKRFNLGNFNLEPDPEPRPDGRRMSGNTIEDPFLPILEDGRLYQSLAPGDYSLPLDGEEQDRLDLSHHFYKLVLDGELAVTRFAKAPPRVLDVGTGTGIWCIQYAAENPSSFVIGTDLSGIQPPPPIDNCIFQMQDFEEPAWSFPQPFDFIHMRSIAPCFHDFPKVVQHSYELLNPGGCIELQDGFWVPECVNNTLEGTSITEFFDNVRKGAAALGHDMLKAKHFKESLEQAGFIDVVDARIAVPCTPWPQGRKNKIIGLYAAKLLSQAMEGYTRFLRASGLKDDQIVALKGRFLADLKRDDIYWYIPVYVRLPVLAIYRPIATVLLTCLSHFVTGTKPLQASESAKHEHT